MPPYAVLGTENAIRIGDGGQLLFWCCVLLLPPYLAASLACSVLCVSLPMSCWCLCPSRHIDSGLLMGLGIQWDQEPGLKRDWVAFVPHTILISKALKRWQVVEGSSLVEGLDGRLWLSNLLCLFLFLKKSEILPIIPLLLRLYVSMSISCKSSGHVVAIIH